MHMFYFSAFCHHVIPSTEGSWIFFHRLSHGVSVDCFLYLLGLLLQPSCYSGTRTLFDVLGLRCGNLSALDRCEILYGAPLSANRACGMLQLRCILLRELGVLGAMT